MLQFRVTSKINKEIYDNVTKYMYPTLNDKDSEMIHKYFCKILDFYSICNYLSEDYINFFRNDNYKDLRWLITYLLPYDINNMNKELTNLNDLYTKKKVECDINKESPKYVFSNLQYNRCIRTGGIFKEKQYSEKHIRDNYYLLLHTIKTSRFKFHINWYNIVPFRKDNYKQHPLYADTKYLKDSRKYKYVDIYSESLDIKGLTIEEIYNTISIDLYESVLPCKWLIFDIVINNKIYNIRKVIELLFNLTYIEKNIEWERLTSDDKNDFSERYSNLKRSFNNKTILLIEFRDTIYEITEYKITTNTIETIIKSICMYFDTINKSNSNIIYTHLNNNNSTIDDIDERKIDKLKYEDIEKTINSIKDEDIYNFIRDSYQQFKNTWYFEKESERIPNVSPKNIYNFCKSLIHYNDTINKKYIRLPKLWVSLDDTNQKLFVDRFNNNTSDWFNIMNNLRNILKQLDNDITNNEINDTMKYIYRIIHGVIVEILFLVLIRKGVLTHFMNDIVYNKNDELINKRFTKDNPYGENSYYYLTNDTFNNLKETDTKGYFDYCKKNKWFLFHAYNWVSQLGFCHRFIHNRVNYITGSTGSGKSTQIPKLYIYYLKSIEHIHDPTVIITVPRLNIISSTGIYVAEEMAVPFKDSNGNITNFNYVQYECSDEKLNNVTKYNINGKYPKIRFVTDGIMLNSVKNVLFRKRKIIDKKISYTRNDICNVLIVDEAHEHNVNMDIILSFAKLIVSYNNKIKLGIVSATIDNDEPIYRRFYRDVNDNRKYPVDLWIQKHKIDRCNTERRFHISSPFDTTQFKIKEIYEPDKKSFEIIKHIIKTTSDGDILLFHSGKKEISNEISILNGNNYLPANVIAIPYYRELDNDVKKLIENINVNKKFIKIDKTKLLDNLKIDLLKEGDNNYDRVIIVSTNIAEASITINGLTYVVDTGKEKSNVFDYKTRTDIIKEDYITDASRIQRRGRVGRVGSGTVYYNYKEDQLINNIKQFKISIEKLDLTLLQMLRDDNDRLIFGKKYKDIHKMLFNENNNKIDINTLKKIFDELSKGLYEIIEEQYIVNNEFYNYYGNLEHYDYTNDKYMIYVYNDGLDIRQLIDTKGDFFIIHPEELNIYRNIGGIVIKSTTNNDDVVIKNNKIISKKIGTFWKMLLDSSLIGEKITSDKKETFFKTDIGYLFQKFISDSRRYEEIDEDILKILFYGFGLSENDNEFTKLNCIMKFIKNLKYTMKTLFIKSDETRDDTIFENTFGKNNSDLETLNNVYEVSKNNNSFNLDSFKDIDNKVINNFLKKDRFNIKLFEKIKTLRDKMYHYRLYMNKLNIDLIKGSLLLALPYNILFKINNTKKSYCSLYKPLKQDILTVTKTYILPHKYILFINKNTEYNNVSLISGIKKEDILFIGNIYRKNIVSILEKYTYVDKVNEELVKAITSLKTTIDEVNIDLSYVVNNTNIWKVISDMKININTYDKLTYFQNN